MIVIDSSLWIEYFIGSSNGLKVKNLLMIDSEIYVPTIIITEVYKKFLNDSNKELAELIQNILISLNTISLNVELSLFAAKCGKLYHLPLADSIIYATSLHHKATLYTMDKHFKDLPNVVYFEKNKN